MDGTLLMISELAKKNGLHVRIPDTDKEQREIVRQLMTVSKPCLLSEAYYSAEKKFIESNKTNQIVIGIDEINERLTDNIYICMEDITNIKADAIVNAANEFLLGCFIPGHHCIDNAIHLSAGLGLRNECDAIMKNTDSAQMVGQAKVTEGHNLKAKHVVHTVGPNLNGPKLMDYNKAKKDLENCYRSCLDAVADYEDINNIVFCSISTGVYGFPIEQASKIAMETIENYLKSHHHHLSKVVIDVFSQEDYDVYKNNAIYGSY